MSSCERTAVCAALTPAMIAFSAIALISLTKMAVSAIPPRARLK